MSEQTSGETASNGGTEQAQERLSTVEQARIYTEMANNGATNAEIAKRLGKTPSSLSVWASNMRKKLKAKKGIDLPRPKSSRGSSTLDDVASAVVSITHQLDEAEQGVDSEASGEESESEATSDDAGVTLEQEQEQEANA